MAARQLLSQLVLGINVEHFGAPEDPEWQLVVSPIRLLLSGDAETLIASPEYAKVFATAREGLAPETSFADSIEHLIDQMDALFAAEFASLGPVHLQVVAITCLQLFVQANFTGPEVTHAFKTTVMGTETFDNGPAIQWLTIEGQPAYDLMEEPGYLVLALRILEKLTQTPANWHTQPLEEFTDAVAKFVASPNPTQASLQWWRARALQVHNAVIGEPADILGTVSQILLNPTVANTLAPAGETDEAVQRAVQLLFFLEAARAHVQGTTEHLAIPQLARAKELSQLELVLTGAKAKRTKFQTYLALSLVVLAKSHGTSLYESDAPVEAPVNLDLESDLLLERPHYELLQDLEFDDDGPASKRLRFDTSEDSDVPAERLFPIALKPELIPAGLRDLDPNNPQRLHDLDSIQILLRMITLGKTLPLGDALVEEEMMAAILRVIFVDGGVNPTVLGRALWQRSLLETLKPKTIERGILQMTLLVEEAGIKIKLRVFAQEEITSATVANRLRFVHQLPLLSSWAMNDQLAQRYMLFGAFKSAIDIYERLGMVHDAAVCYAATDDMAMAKKLIEDRLATHPNDARALLILGDFTMDPELWERAWEAGKYPKAKASLAKYWYSPPAGIERNVDLSIKHMHQCLSVNPLSFDNWFFYGCCGLETGQFELAAEAFLRCVALDDTSAQAWLNLALALLQDEQKLKPAFSALKRAVRLGYETKQWKIFENYLTVAMKLNEWQEATTAAGRLLKMRLGEAAVDDDVFDELATVLCTTDVSEQTHFQRSTTELICTELPKVITTNARLWRIVAKVEVWRKRPWAALEAYEKAARAMTLRPEVEYDAKAWDDAVDAVADVVAAYENFGEMPGRLGAGEVVCEKWRYKAKQAIRSLMLRGKDVFEDSPGWDRLLQLRDEL